MWLIIDTSSNDLVRFFYSEGKSWEEKTFSIQDTLGILQSLDTLLQDLGRSKADIQGIGLVQGKGRFTATRVAATLSNMFGYSLKVPVIGVVGVPTESPEKLFSGLVPGQYVSAAYSAEASIGKKKD